MHEDHSLPVVQTQQEPVLKLDKTYLSTYRNTLVTKNNVLGMATRVSVVIQSR